MTDEAESDPGRRMSRREPAQPFVGAYLPALLARVHAIVSGEFHAVAATHGCAAAEWRVLATLAEGQPVSIGRLAGIVVMKQPTLTRVLDRMVAAGQVHRVRHPGDRRIVLVSITPAGRQLARKLVPLARSHERSLLRPLGPRRAAEMKAGLQRLITLHGPAAEDHAEP